MGDEEQVLPPPINFLIWETLQSEGGCADRRVDTNGELSPPCLWVCGQEGQCEDVRVQLHASVRVSERV